MKKRLDFHLNDDETEFIKCSDLKCPKIHYAFTSKSDADASFNRSQFKGFEKRIIEPDINKRNKEIFDFWKFFFCDSYDHYHYGYSSRIDQMSEPDIFRVTNQKCNLPIATNLGNERKYENNKLITPKSNVSTNNIYSNNSVILAHRVVNVYGDNNVICSDSADAHINAFGNNNYCLVIGGDAGVSFYGVGNYGEAYGGGAKCYFFAPDNNMRYGQLKKYIPWYVTMDGRHPQNRTVTEVTESGSFMGGGRYDINADNIKVKIFGSGSEIKVKGQNTKIIVYGSNSIISPCNNDIVFDFVDKGYENQIEDPTLMGF